MSGAVLRERGMSLYRQRCSRPCYSGYALHQQGKLPLKACNASCAARTGIGARRLHARCGRLTIVRRCICYWACSTIVTPRCVPPRSTRTSAIGCCALFGALLALTSKRTPLR